MCFARSILGPVLFQVWFRIQEGGWSRRWVQVHLKSLLVVIIVISSQLLQEASKRLCRLGVFLLQPLKDILNATLNPRVERVGISSFYALLVDALGDNLAKEHLAVALVCCLHVSS